jgi:hypothetical protein
MNCFIRPNFLSWLDPCTHPWLQSPQDNIFLSIRQIDIEVSPMKPFLTSVCEGVWRNLFPCSVAVFILRSDWSNGSELFSFLARYFTSKRPLLRLFRTRYNLTHQSTNRGSPGLFPQILQSWQHAHAPRHRLEKKCLPLSRLYGGLKTRRYTSISELYAELLQSTSRCYLPVYLTIERE